MIELFHRPKNPNDRFALMDSFWATLSAPMTGGRPYLSIIREWSPSCAEGGVSSTEVLQTTEADGRELEGPSPTPYGFPAVPANAAQ